MAPICGIVVFVTRFFSLPAGTAGSHTAGAGANEPLCTMANVTAEPEGNTAVAEQHGGGTSLETAGQVYARL